MTTYVARIAHDAPAQAHLGPSLPVSTSLRSPLQPALTPFYNQVWAVWVKSELQAATSPNGWRRLERA